MWYEDTVDIMTPTSLFQNELKEEERKNRFIKKDIMSGSHVVQLSYLSPIIWRMCWVEVIIHKVVTVELIGIHIVDVRQFMISW